MAHSQPNNHLTKEQIGVLLKGPENCLANTEAKIKISNSDKTVLKRPIEKFAALHIDKKEFGNADQYNHFIANFDHIDFYVDSENEDSIFYSLSLKTNTYSYDLKESGFLKLPK
ncbi:hypothetical protein ACTHOQ_10490 [Solibacillus silvestris]|uniref:hypothetical protein n=1 Tax=Solibacillus silvestris TaxID=76853 RepID=UPI003F81339A